LVGLTQGLRLLTGLISEFWDSLHPRLDPDDNLDPSARLNALLMLRELDTMLRPVRSIPLIRSQIFGAITYRDIEVAEGKTTATKGAPVYDGATIAGAFQDCDLDELSSAAIAASAALAEAHALGDALASYVAPQSMPDLAPLTGLLASIRGALQARLDERVPASETEDATQAEAYPSDSGDGSPVVMRPVGSTQISSRDDVVRALDKLCDYYARYEPSSPVPLLLKRARRLVNGSFVDIVRDLAPDAITQIQAVCGRDDDA
jgi:type VI secretion system protein ImpA